MTKSVATHRMFGEHRENRKDAYRILKSNSQKGESTRENVIPYAKDEFHLHYSFTSVELGRGEFGIVRKCSNRKNGQTYACKTIEKSNLRLNERIEELKMEVYVMRILPKHSNLVNLIDVFEDKSFVYLVMEYCEGGDLFDLVSSSKYFKEPEAVWIFRKVLEALNLCHSQGVVHLDVKPENVFISLGQHVSRQGQESPKGIEFKLGDFGQAMVLSKDEFALGLTGSSFYMAPEIILGKPYNKTADIWSLGVLLYVLLSGNLPFWGRSNSQTFSAICKGRFDLTSAAWSSVSGEAKHLIQWMLRQNPNLRPSTEEIFEHPWLYERNNSMNPDSSEETSTTAIVKDLKQNLQSEKKQQNPHLFERIRRINSRKIFSRKKTMRSEVDRDRKARVVSELLKAYQCPGCEIDLEKCVKVEESQTPFNSVDYSDRDLAFCEQDDFEQSESETLCPTCTPIEINLDMEHSDSDDSSSLSECTLDLRHSHSHGSSTREGSTDNCSPDSTGFGFHEAAENLERGRNLKPVSVTQSSKPLQGDERTPEERKKSKWKTEGSLSLNLNQALPSLWRSLTIWRASPCPSPHIVDRQENAQILDPQTPS